MKTPYVIHIFFSKKNNKDRRIIKYYACKIKDYFFHYNNYNTKKTRLTFIDFDVS